MDAKRLKLTVFDICAEIEKENNKKRITVGEWLSVKKNKKTLKNYQKTFDKGECFMVLYRKEEKEVSK